MVKKFVKKRKVYFQCEACGFFYLEEAVAGKCEKFCLEHNACSMEITKYAVKPEK